MVPRTNQQLRISRIKVNLISGHPCLNFSLASGQQSNLLLQGSVTNFFFHKHYGKKKEKRKKGCSWKVCEVLCITCADGAKIGAEQNAQLSSYKRAQQKHIMSSHAYVCSGEGGEALLIPHPSPPDEEFVWVFSSLLYLVYAIVDEHWLTHFSS